MFFDPRAAKQLAPNTHMLIDGCEGLRLEARSTCKTWIYRYKLAGRMKQTTLGQWPSMSVQAAVVEWQGLRDQKAKGADPKALKKAKAPSAAVSHAYSVRTLVMDHITDRIEAGRKAEGAAAARRALERLLDDEPAFAAGTPAEVTRGVAFQILEARKATPTAAAKLRSMLGGAWDYGLDAGKIGGDVPNWWRQVQRGRLKSQGKIVGGKHVGRERRVLHDSELAVLVPWAEANMHALGRDALIAYLWSCARGSEILSMRPEHLGEERDGWWWTVPKALTKNAAKEFATDHRVPLVGRLLEVVKRRLESVGQSGLLFEDQRGEQYEQKDFGTYVYSLQPYSAKTKARQGQGLVVPVTHWTPHNLRRTSRTMLAAIGCPKEVGEAIVGHLPEEIDATYNAYRYDKERRAWLTKLAKHLENVIPG